MHAFAATMGPGRSPRARLDLRWIAEGVYIRSDEVLHFVLCVSDFRVRVS